MKRFSDRMKGRGREGFSLIEVNVAILVIAGGLLSLFTLFPAGLRLSSSAMSDTRQALFADDFFAYFDDGVRLIEDRDDWQNIETFWDAARDGLENGFGSDAQLDDTDWRADDAVRKRWSNGDEDLKNSDFTKGNPNQLGKQFFLRFRSGIIRKYFNEDTKSPLDAEFLVRIASDYAGTDSSGEATPADRLVWRVSLVVSDDGTGGYFYDNSVYHRDFRFAELP